MNKQKSAKTIAWEKFKTTTLWKKLTDSKFLKYPDPDAHGLRNRIKDAFYHGYDSNSK